MEEIRQRSVDKIKYTQEQMDCLTYAGSRTLMVKGYAGSGKSLILEAIAKKYRDFYGYQRINGVMIFTYQNTLVSVVRENMELEGDVNEAIQVSTWNQYENQVYEQLIQEGKVPSVRYPYGRHAEEHRLNNVAAALELHRNRYGKHRLLDLPVKFWLAEFDWMKEKNIWINDQENYLKLPRTGRGDIVRMHMQDRIEAYGIFTTYCQYLNQTKQGDWIDRTLYLARHPELIPESRKYEHVLIDEAQDLSLVQMKAMMNVYTKDMDKQYDSEFVVQKTVLDYEDLLAKADLETYIFAFKCMETYTLPDGWMEKLKSVTNKLTGLKNTIERYPEREDEIHRFLSYYIPEGIRIVHDFYIYQNSGVEDRIMDKMYEKITASMDTLDAALTKKMQEMYRLETISTIAKADALKQVMEQDGYINDKLQMKH